MLRTLVIAGAIAILGAAGDAAALQDAFGVVGVGLSASCRTGHLCYDVEVTCLDQPNEPTRLASVRFHDPGGAATGTVWFARGAEAITFWSGAIQSCDDIGYESFDIDDPLDRTHGCWEGYAGDIVDDVFAAGGQTLEVRFPNQRYQGAVDGFVPAYCTEAALIKWAKLNFATGEPLCAIGSSGGGSAIGYGLARYSLGDILDVAVLVSGPPHSRIDVACFGADSRYVRAGDETRADGAVMGPTNLGRQLMDRVHGYDDPWHQCWDGGNGGNPSEPYVGELFADSVAEVPGGVYHYPETALHFFYSPGDRSGGEVGDYYFEAVTSQASRTPVGDEPKSEIFEDRGMHDIFTTRPLWQLASPVLTSAACIQPAAVPSLPHGAWVALVVTLLAGAWLLRPAR